MSESDDQTLFSGDEPIALFHRWLAEAEKTELNEANAMTVATADSDGMPDARMVLLKAADLSGFVFYTNTQSNKGLQLAANPQAALLFHWKSLRRQVRVRGAVTAVTDAEADAYFATRARTSQIGAWASDQSRSMEGRFVLERRLAEFALKFGVKPVPRPPHWSGYRITPRRIEFWHDGAFRLHDRKVFERVAPDAPWTTSRLFP